LIHAEKGGATAGEGCIRGRQKTGREEEGRRQESEAARGAISGG